MSQDGRYQKNQLHQKMARLNPRGLCGTSNIYIASNGKSPFLIGDTSTHSWWISHCHISLPAVKKKNTKHKGMAISSRSFIFWSAYECCIGRDTLPTSKRIDPKALLGIFRKSFESTKMPPIFSSTPIPNQINSQHTNTFFGSKNAHTIFIIYCATYIGIV